MEVLLVMVLYLAGDPQPKMAQVPATSLKECMAYAQQFLESDTVKEARAASAGCAVKNNDKPA